MYGARHFIYGDFYSQKYSWMRLSIHLCDKTSRHAQNKTCEEQDKIEEYFAKTLVGVDLLHKVPSLKYQESSKILVK